MTFGKPFYASADFFDEINSDPIESHNIEVSAFGSTADRVIAVVYQGSLKSLSEAFLQFY